MLLIAIGCRQITPFTLDAFPDPEPLGPIERDDEVLGVDEDLQFERANANADEEWEPTDVDVPLRLTIEDAVLTALRNNRGLRVEQYEPMIAGTFEQIERARFDPVIFGEASFARERRQQLSPATREIFDTLGEDWRGIVGVEQELPTGTIVDLSLSHVRSTSDRVPEQHAGRLGLTLTQALLRGGNWDANVATIRQARLDTLASQYELRGFAENLVADVETTFWDVLLAEREIEIFENSLDLAAQQLNETERRVEVGVVAETELAAARAEIAQRREELINARSTLKQARLRLLRLVNPRVNSDGWVRAIELEGEVQPGEEIMEPPEMHMRLARRMRPELNEARLRLEQGRLEVIRTRDGLLPRLDFFLTFGKSGFADAFGEAWRDLDGRGYDLQAGLQFSYPIGNRAAEYDHQRARFSRSQASASLQNLAQLVDLDILLAHVEVERALEQIEATRATRELREETLRAEQEKFRVGTSTAFLVAQAQRNLLESQIAEVRAMVEYRQTLIELYRLEGSLLKRRAIRAPGHEPIRGGVEIGG